MFFFRDTKLLEGLYRDMSMSGPVIAVTYEANPRLRLAAIDRTHRQARGLGDMDRYYDDRVRRIFFHAWIQSAVAVIFAVTPDKLRSTHFAGDDFCAFEHAKNVLA
jgi:hypothetical protein